MLTLAAVTAAAQHSPETGARVAELQEVATCSFNRLLPDPTSRRVILWGAARDLRAPLNTAIPGEFVLADLPPNEANEEALPRVAAVMALRRLEPLRWSESGDRLLFRIGISTAVLFDAATHALAAAPDMDPLWARMRIRAVSHGGTNFYRDGQALATLRRIERDGSPVRATATIGRSASFLVFRLGNRHRLTAYRAGRSWETGIPLPFAHAPLLTDGARRPTFLGDQDGYRSFLPYAMPLPDLASGRIAGRFGWERIELRGGRTIDLAPHFRQLINILDAAANGDTVFALLDLEREMRVVRIRGDEIRSWPLCEKRGLQVGTRLFPAVNSLPAEVPVTRTEIRFGSRHGPFGQLYRPLRAEGRLIVYFHGGPTATLAERTVPQEVSTFAARGISVLNVEYSGMVGGGLALSERLPRLGFRALRQDVEAITAWVRRSGFRQVYLLADSFGGAPAVIAAVEHPGDYEHIFLRAPFLALRDPRQSVRRGQLLSPDPPADSQLEFEQMVYGGARGRTRFGADLQAYGQRLRPSPRLSFYFGGIDPVSAASDLPPAFAGDRSVMILPRRAHELVAADWAVRDDIFSKIDRDTAPASAPSQSRRHAQGN